MEGAALIADALSRVRDTLHRCLPGVDAETLRKMPSADANSMAWLAWHLTRVQDNHLSGLAGREAAWMAEGWHERFGMPSANDVGFGWTPAQVAEFSVESADLLLAHHDAVFSRSKEYLAALRPEDLDHVLDESQWDPRPTVAVRLVSVVNDNTQHAGQVIYLRGHWHGFGWQNA